MLWNARITRIRSLAVIGLYTTANRFPLGLVCWISGFCYIGNGPGLCFVSWLIICRRLSLGPSITSVVAATPARLGFRDEIAVAQDDKVELPFLPGSTYYLSLPTVDLVIYMFPCLSHPCIGPCCHIASSISLKHGPRLILAPSPPRMKLLLSRGILLDRYGYKSR
jgi:hypothetical protein